MRKDLVRIVLAATLIILTAPPSKADTVKLKYTLSVYLDETGASIKHPESVACRENSEFIVADTGNNRLIRYTFQDDGLKGGTEIRVPELSYPIRVRVNSRGEIFSLDGKRRRIVHMSPEGVFNAFLEPKGVPTPSSIVPRNFEIDKKDGIYILDILSGRVIVLDPTGNYKRHVDFPEDYGSISDLAIDPAGNILLIDSTKAMVYSASPEAKIFSPLSKDLKNHTKFPTGITTDGNGIIYLTDKHGGSIIILGPDGIFQRQLLSLGWTEGSLYYPTSLCVNGSGEVFIADRNNSRVQIFSVVR